MSAKSKGRSRLAIRYFDDRVLLTDMHAWAYYRVPSVSYEFTTPDEREALATNITVALAAIRMQDAEVHLRIAHRPYPAVEWATGLDNTADGGPGWREYLEEIYQHVWAKDFWSKEIYLGVRLGQRSVRAQLTDGLFGNLFNNYRPAERTGPGGGHGAGRRGRQVDGPGGAARPRAHRVRARGPARELARGGVALPAHAHGLARATRRRRRHAEGPGSQVKSSSCTRVRCTMAVRCCGLSRSRVTRGRRSCPSPASPT